MDTFEVKIFLSKYIRLDLTPGIADRIHCIKIEVRLHGGAWWVWYMRADGDREERHAVITGEVYVLPVEDQGSKLFAA